MSFDRISQVRVSRNIVASAFATVAVLSTPTAPIAAALSSDTATVLLFVLVVLLMP